LRFLATEATEHTEKKTKIAAKRHKKHEEKYSHRAHRDENNQLEGPADLIELPNISVELRQAIVKMVR
jgi:hypothetical protein